MTYRKFTYKQRLYLLLAVGFLAFILSYQIAITETVKTKNALKDIQVKLGQIKTAPESIAVLEKRIAAVNNMIGANLSDVPEFQKNLLDRISGYCADNSLVLKEFPQVHTWIRQDYQFITGFASIEGSFVPLVKLLYELETSALNGRIVSADFASSADRQLKKKRLIMSVYIQTIKQTNHTGSE